MSKKLVCVFGVGEVGGAISKILATKYKVLEKDLDLDEVGSKKIEVLHVCLPYSKSMSKLVSLQAKLNKPSLIIIHSTVKLGTSREISRLTKKPTVHSPVMGTHPGLKRDILSFTKIIGPTNKKSALLAVAHFKSVGIKTIVLKSSDESELGKLLDTTYYGWNIMFNKAVFKLCQENKLDFNDVYLKFNLVYNQGYKKSKPNVIRPILNYQKGKIGGHCIIPNLEILQSIKKTEIGSFILEQNKKIKN